MSFKDDIVIVSGARTPMREYNVVLKDFTQSELGALAAREAIQRAGADARETDHVIIGNAMQASADPIYRARHVGQMQCRPAGFQYSNLIGQES